MMFLGHVAGRFCDPAPQEWLRDAAPWEPGENPIYKKTREWLKGQRAETGTSASSRLVKK